jgi:hypothetical protein
MALQKITPLVLLMFTLVCALPATVVSPPSAIAQEDDEEAENLASDTVSNVLDNGNTAGDNTNTQLSVPLRDQDQTDVNLGLSEALDVTDVTVERTLTPPQEEEEPPEFVAFCFVSGFSPNPFCFDTSEECENAEEFLGGFTPNVSDCEGVEVLPPDALSCVNLEDEQGEIVTVSCGPPEDT